MQAGDTSASTPSEQRTAAGRPWPQQGGAPPLQAAAAGRPVRRARQRCGAAPPPCRLQGRGDADVWLASWPTGHGLAWHKNRLDTAVGRVTYPQDHHGTDSTLARASGCQARWFRSGPPTHRVPCRMDSANACGGDKAPVAGAPACCWLPAAASDAAAMSAACCLPTAKPWDATASAGAAAGRGARHGAGRDSLLGCAAAGLPPAQLGLLSSSRRRFVAGLWPACCCPASQCACWVCCAASR